MATLGGAAARARVAPTATASAGPIRDASASTSSASRSVLRAVPRRPLRRVGSGAPKVSSTRASATPSSGGAGGGGTRASRRRERRALERKAETSDPKGDPPNGNGVGSRAVDAERVPAPTGALVVDARGEAVGRDGASSVPSASRPTRRPPGMISARSRDADDEADDEADDDDADDDASRDASSRTKPSARSASSALAVETSQHKHLGAAASVPDALRKLRAGLRDLARDAADGSLPPFSSGLVRLVASAPRHVDALEWLRGARANGDVVSRSPLLPAYYLSPRTPPPAVRSGDGDDGPDEAESASAPRRGARVERARARNDVAEPSSWRSDPRGAVAAVGGAVVWTGADGFDDDVLADVRRFARARGALGGSGSDESGPRVYGAGRFDPATAPAEEWARFGGHYFFLPTLEVAEGARSATVAVVVAWDAAFDAEEARDAEAARDAAKPAKTTRGAASLAAAVARAADTIDAALGEPERRDVGGAFRESERRSLPLAPPGAATPLGKTLEPDRAGWSATVDGLLRKLREGEAAAAETARPAERADGAAEAAAELERTSERRYERTEPNSNYVWDELDAYGEDAYIDDFASGDGYGGGAASASGRSIRDRLLDLGRAAGVEAPPAAVLEELEASAMAAGLGSASKPPAGGFETATGGSGVFSGGSFAPRGETRVDANAGDAGSVGIGWSVDESVVDDDDDDVARAAAALAPGAADASSFGDEEARTTARATLDRDDATAPLRKVVLARRSTMTFREPMDALALVSSLEARDPDAYQFALVHEDGAAFVGSTPERLFAARDGRAASEAVAGTRPRGSDEGEDAALAYEMLLSPKEHEEFSIVREEVRNALARVAKNGASGVEAELEKGVLRHVSVQHLYARLGCALADGTSEADVLRALHPTPAVCGHPRAAALDAIRAAEPFDRGLYAGPLGWIGAESAEFAVAIRSALLETETEPKRAETSGGTVMRLYAGVGVVAAADAVAEWRELNLKTTPLESLVDARGGVSPPEDAAVGAETTETGETNATGPDGTDRTRHRAAPLAGSRALAASLASTSALASAPNPNQAWADVLVGELFRDGVGVFCVAPGSRSTPLALAAERHPCARVVVCVDERSLAFYALGVGKGAGAGAAGAAVITSSGTAVANLLPAAVEAAESASPLLLLTADRPPELRGSGANQTIDQTKIFGSFARFEADLPPPGDGAPARVWATAANAATRVLRGARPGPVHLNCQFRDPLGPEPSAWNPERDLRGLEGWEARASPLSFSSARRRERDVSVGSGESRAAARDESGVRALARLARRARRGVLVVAGGASDGAAAALAAAELAACLGWAVVADAASGLRAGDGDPKSFCPHALDVIDVSLCSASMRAFFKPDVIVQLNPRLTSKRVQTALEAAALDGGAAWAVVTPQETRADPAHCVSLHVSADAATAAAALVEALGLSPAGNGAARGALFADYRASPEYASCASFRDALLAADAAAAREARAALRDLETEEGITEMGVALAVADALPRSMGLFLGNSMPIRDVDALAGVAKAGADARARRPDDGDVPFAPGAPTAANRGASGIDGVLSAAAGYAAGLGRPVTLLVGDVSFQHDANGLLLLRERPGQPPVTVVVVNNGGGGIFSFLPVSDQIDQARFTKLFATPPDVSRRGLCDAHRVAHAHPSTPAALRAALEAAWAEGRHSVVEVTTSRARNLAQHKELQRRVAEAVDAALALEKRFEKEAEAEAEEADPTGTAHPRAVVSSTVSRFALPMLREPTTFVDPVIDPEDPEETKRARAGTTRVGYILEVRLANGAVGRGEASPLPGLHRESAAEAGAQLRVVAAALESAVVPATLPLLGGAVTDWLCETVGIRVVDALLPSVRFALESAVLSALVAGAAAHSETKEKIRTEKAFALADALAYGAARVSPSEGSNSVSNQTRAVEINALIASCDGDTPESAAREAAALVKQGYRCLKIKVARGSGAAADADRVEAIREAVGPDVALRCDANRGWSLNDALAFGLRAMRFDLQYVEEPVRDIESDLAAFHCTTGVPVALDESVDDALLRARNKNNASVADALEELFEPTFGVVALVLKPGVLGGFEACAAAAAAARTKGINAVVTTAFESGVGVSACAHLAAALDAAAERERERSQPRIDDDDDSDSIVAESRSSLVSLDDDTNEPNPVASRLRAMQHGLGTGAWLDGDVTETPIAPIVSIRCDAANGNQSGGVGVALESDGAFGNVAPFLTSIVTPETSIGISRENDSRENDDRILSSSSSVVWGSIEVREVVTPRGTYRFRVRDSRGTFRDDDAKGSDAKIAKRSSVLFLHGFMGGMEDWDAVARGLVSEARCVAADMPGHGGTTFLPANGNAEAEGYGIEAMAEAVAKLGDSLFGGDDDTPVTVVGYSMGARVALATAAACANEETPSSPSFLKKKRGGRVVSIGGSPGIAGGDARRARAERDDALAEVLRASGVEPFARAWYTQSLFGSLTAHPRFSVARLARRRAASLENARVRNGDELLSASAAASAAAERLAATLSAASPGRQIEVSAASLAASGVRVDFVTGALDAKFVKIAQTLAEETRVCLEASGVTEARVTESTVPGAGHAAHLEAPEALVLRLLRAIRFDEEL